MAVKEEVIRIPLSDILVDHKWNARSGGWQNAPDTVDESKDGEDADGGTGLAGLIMSLKLVGQDVAVDVRKNPRGGKQPYMLVTGFRRVEALSRIAAEKVKIPGWDDFSKPTVKVSVRELSESEARSLNIRENTERDNLSSADVAWAIADLGETHKMTDVAMAQQLGKSQGYVSKLHRIVKGLNADLLGKWRDLPKEEAPSYTHMLKVAELPKNEQKPAYDALVGAADQRGGGGAAWMKTSSKQAEKIGELIGVLERLELIDASALKFDKKIRVFAEETRLLTVRGKSESGATNKQWKDLADAMQAGYELGLNPPVEEEEEEEEETAAE